MSIKCVHWALNDAPVEEPVEVLILVAMAERAADDGTTTYQSVATIASKARISVRTCQTKLRKLEEAGIIRRGDQQHTEHLPSNRRPVVYDLAVHLVRGANSAPQEIRGAESALRGANSELRGAEQSTLGVQLFADNSSLNSSLSDSSKDSGSAPKPQKQSSPVPNPFIVTAELESWAKMETPLADAKRETPKFVDHHTSEGNRKKDWTAAWRNWMRNEQRYATERLQRQQQPQAQRPQYEAPAKLGLTYDGWDEH
jgi:hypothetical protein